MQVSGALATYMAYQFAKLLKDRFVDWDAYKLGLIDEKGNIIKSPKTKEEKDSLNYLINLARKIKIVLVRYVGDNRMVNFLIAAYLLKSESKQDDSIANEIQESLTAKELLTLDSISLTLVELQDDI